MFRTKPSPRPPAPLRVEQLEPREVPATMFAVNAGGLRLLTFDSASPGTTQGNVAIAGLATGEKITDIDVRPSTGQLYGRSNLSQLYLINPLTGFVSRVGSGIPTDAPNVGISFDPVDDQLRVVSNKGENLVVNPNDGTVVAVGQPLVYRNGDQFQGRSARVAAIAFNRAVPSATSTTLYGIDHRRDTLVRIGQSIGNAAQVTTVGPLGIAITSRVGFDIDPVTNVGYATVRVSGVSGSVFMSIDLSNGTATTISMVGNGRSIADIAVSVGGTTGSVGTIGTGIIIPPLTNPILTPTFPTTFFNNPSLLTSTPLFNSTSPLFPTLTQPLGGGLFAPTFGATGGGLFAPTFSTATGGNLFAPTFSTTTPTTSLFGGGSTFGTSTFSSMTPLVF